MMPPKVVSHEYHEQPMKFHLPNGKKHGVMCDLGFSGVIDGRVVWTFGDTLMGQDDPETSIEKQHKGIESPFTDSLTS